MGEEQEPPCIYAGEASDTPFRPVGKTGYALVGDLSIWYNTIRARTDTSPRLYFWEERFLELWKYPGLATLASNYVARVSLS